MYTEKKLARLTHGPMNGVLVCVVTILPQNNFIYCSCIPYPVFRNNKLLQFSKKAK